jgi:thiosulfate/3-mercaptopyruvate sulfurtransferase
MNGNDYGRPELLTDTAWVAEHSGDADVRLIDCAAVEAYRRAHIPNAVGLGGTNPYIKASGDETFVMPPDEFAKFMGDLGVGDDTLVISYDDNNALFAARLWWVLQYYGHSKAKVLNGGWHKWLYEGRPVTTHAAHPQRATFTPAANDDFICRIDRLTNAISDSGVDILDVRSDEEFQGSNSRGNRRAGHVPGASHVEWLDFVSKDDQRLFLPASDINAMLDKADIDRAHEVITYCQGGIRAAHAMFVLELLGFERVRNYDGSMREWANRDDTALEIPS